MAITQTGTIQRFAFSSTAASGTVSSAITVPDDAQIVIVGISHFQGSANGLAAMAFTKGATQAAMTKVTGMDASSGSWQGAMFWLDAPDTGTNKALTWAWSGTSADAENLVGVSFWKGIDTGGPVRDSEGAQTSGLPVNTGTLTAQTNDKIVAFSAGFTLTEGTVDTWTNLTTLENMDSSGSADGAWATADPTGNVAVGAATGTDYTEPSIGAIVLAPEAGAGSVPLGQIMLW